MKQTAQTALTASPFDLWFGVGELFGFSYILYPPVSNARVDIRASYEFVASGDAPLAAGKPLSEDARVQAASCRHAGENGLAQGRMFVVCLVSIVWVSVAQIVKFPFLGGLQDIGDRSLVCEAGPEGIRPSASDRA